MTIVTGGPDQIRDDCSMRGGRQELRRHDRTALLVVRSMGVVNDVMEPDRKFHGNRVDGVVDVFVEAHQSIGNVIQIVVGTNWIPVCG